MKNLYSVYDSFLDEFLPPFVAKNDNMALLSYEQYLEKHPLYKNQVTKVFSIGTFDENKGSLGVFVDSRCLKVYGKDFEIKNLKGEKENG